MRAAPHRAAAQVVLFDGKDPGAGPLAAHPLSTAAAAAFDGTAGADPFARELYTPFEDQPVRSFVALGTPIGVLVTFTAASSAASASVEFGSGDRFLGYNTTPLGQKYVRVSPGSVAAMPTLTFTALGPLEGFGAYITGLGSAGGELFLAFDDGTPRVLTITGSPTGGAQFFGFIDPGARFTSLSLQLRGGTAADIFAIDDVRFLANLRPAAPPPGTPAPEPGTAALCATGLAAAAGVGVRRRRYS